MKIRDFFEHGHTEHYNIIVVDFEGNDDIDIDDAYHDVDNSVYMNYLKNIGLDEYNEQRARMRNINYNAEVLWIGVEDGVLTMYIDSEEALR